MNTRYDYVGVVRALTLTGTEKAIFYMDMFMPVGDRIRYCIEPIADEI